MPDPTEKPPEPNTMRIILTYLGLVLIGCLIFVGGCVALIFIGK
jgi:hypothetical protein